jgi:hypothetical protein
MYVIYRPTYNRDGSYRRLEYWTGDEFETDPRYAKLYPSEDSCKRAKSQLRKNHGILLSHPVATLTALVGAYRMRDRDLQSARGAS